MSVLKTLADHIGVLVVQNAEQADLIMRLQQKLGSLAAAQSSPEKTAGYEGNDQEGISYSSSQRGAEQKE